MIARAALAFALVASSPALADDDGDEAYFTFDSLLVSPIQPLDEALGQRAAELERELRVRLEQVVLLVDIEEVESFRVQGYDARTYVQACPSGEYTGCALVVGQRAAADWVVGGTLTPLPDDLFGTGPQQVLEIHFVDVRASRELLAFGVVVGGNTDDADVLDQVASVFGRIVDGAFEEIDIRGSIEDPKVAAQLERARAKVVAESLDQLEQAIGSIERPEVLREVQPPRITRRELVETYADRDDTAPWERLSMTEQQYVRFRNSGRSLEEWRRRLRGRTGQVVIRAGFGTGGGPWGVNHEGQYLIGFDDQTQAFRTLEVVQHQELTRSPSTSFEGEVAVGLLPFLDVGFSVVSRSGKVTFRFDQETEGEPSFVAPISGTNAQTFQLGPRLTLAPLPMQPVRPHVALGVSFWRGRGVPPDNEAFVRLEPPRTALLTVAPGVEASVGKQLDVFLRAVVDSRVAGRTLDERREGPELLLEPPVPTGDPGLGIAVQAGVQVRLTVLGDRRSTSAPSRFDDDEL